MSVLIKGMKIPEDCFSCPLKEEGFCNITNAYAGGINKRNSDCPLVELPEHHGRLIDADEMKNLWAGCSINGSISPLLDARPTVVEAE